MEKIDELYINDQIAKGSIKNLIEIRDSFSYLLNRTAREICERIDLYFKRRAEIIEIINVASKVSGKEDYHFEHDIFLVEARVTCKHIVEAKGLYTQALNEYLVNIVSLKITVIDNEKEVRHLF
jgi:hypothetical protein